MTKSLAHITKIGPAFELKTSPVENLYLGPFVPGTRVTWRKTILHTGVVVGIVWGMHLSGKSVTVDVEAVDYIVVRWDADAKIEVVEMESVMLTASVPQCRECDAHAVDTDGSCLECGFDEGREAA